MRYLLIGLLLAMCTIMFSQPVNTFTGDYVQPTPETAAIGHFIENPVGPLTGTANVNIPIGSVGDGSLSVPVSLSYNTGGIKVEQLATNVGMNWNLNAGGHLSRMVLGLPDDVTDGGAYFGYNVSGNLMVNNGGLPLAFQELVHLGTFDTEADIFSFSAGNYSGKFYIDKDGNAVIMNGEHIKIEVNSEPNSTRWDQFIITTPEGNKYFFGISEDGTESAFEIMNTYAEPFNPNDDPLGIEHKVGWKLLTIQNHNENDQIDFVYDSEYYSYKQKAKCKTRKGTLILTAWCPGTYTIDDIECPIGTGNLNNFIHDVVGSRIKSIIAPTQKIDFVYQDIRQDLDNGLITSNGIGPAKELDLIQVSKGNSSTKFHLSQTYYQNCEGATVESHEKRLRLNSVTQKNGGGTQSLPPFVFSYKNDCLPHRMFLGQDHWGFYNAANNESETVLCPETEIQSPIGSMTFGGADREVNETLMDHGLLYKIDYPTGASQEFEYEANETHEEKVIIDPDLRLMFCGPDVDPLFFACGLEPSSDTKTFSPLDISTGKFILTLLPYDPGNNAGNGFNYDLQYGLTIKEVVTGNTVYNNPNVFSTTVTNGTGPSSSFEIELGSNGLNLSQGTNYEITISVASSPNGSPNNGVARLCLETTVLDNIPVGGARVKSSIVNDGFSTNPIIKSYSYHSKLDASISSGFLYSKPNYGSFSAGSDGNMSYFVFKWYPNSTLPLQGYSGGHINYTYVEEKNLGDNAKTAFTYRVLDPVFEGVGTFPITPLKLNSRHGTLIKKEDKFGQMTRQSIENTYHNFLTPVSSTPPPFSSYSSPMYAYDHFAKHVPGSLDTCYLNILFTNLYQPTQSRLYQTSKKVILDEVETTTSYTYDPNWEFLYPLEESFTDSENKIRKTKYFYTEDYATGAVKTELESRNIQLPAWKTEQYVGSTQTDGSKTTFAFYDNAGSNPSSSSTPHLYPHIVSRYEMTWNAPGNPQSNSWVDRLTFDEYDLNAGKPKKLTQLGWDPTFIVYNGDKQTTSISFNQHTKSFGYHTVSKLLQSTTEINGVTTFYNYDSFNRLRSTLDNCRGVSTVYDYHFKDQPLNGIGGSQNMNFIKTTTTFPSTTNPANGGSSALSTLENYLYQDGLGRELSLVRKGQGQNGGDLIGFNTYYSSGALQKEMVPTESVGNNGAFLNLSSSPSFTLYNYYSDPLRRIKNVTDPNGFTTHYSYESNGAGDVTGYGADHLYRTKVTDPDGLIQLSYKDRTDKLILTQNTDGINQSNTQNFYDDKDRLIKIVPPGTAHANINYTYTYDEADNMLTKKLPDIGVKEYAYDIRNLSIAHKDPLMVSNGKSWYVTEYDAYGRPKSEGFGTYSGGVVNLTELLIENAYDGDGTSNATNPAYKGQLHYSKTNILDGFNPSPNYIEVDYQFDPCGRVSQQETTNPLHNQQTVDYIYDNADNILNENIDNDALLGTISYDIDHAGRMINTSLVSQGASLACSITYNAREQVAQKTLGSGLQTLDYTYLPNGWLSAINAPTTGNQALVTCPNVNPITTGTGVDDLFYLKLNYDQVTQGGIARSNGNISEMIWQTKGKAPEWYTFQYDFLNRVKAASSSTNGAYNTAYTYDDRGNIMTLQRQGLVYNGSCYESLPIDDLNFTLKDNGNSNQYTVITDNISNCPDFIHLNTIDQSGAYGARIKLSTDAQSDGNKQIDIRAEQDEVLMEAGFEFSSDGAGTLLAHIDDCPQPNLATTGGTNQMGFIPNNPNGLDYLYDLNGNMIQDPNKGMKIFYNHNNLPYQVMDLNNNILIEWLYTAAGQKIEKKSHLSAGLETKVYYGNIELQNGVWEAMYGDSGRIYNANGTASSEYFIKDHLGNTRMSFADKNSNGAIDITSDPITSEVLAETHYYPFGLQQSGPWIEAAGSDNDYKYNGKELTDEFGLNWLDYGARIFDPILARWNSIDPLSSNMSNWSHYNYTFNNPIKYIDPDGMKPISSDPINGGRLPMATISAKRCYCLSDPKFRRTLQAAVKGEGLSILPGSGGDTEWSRDMKNVFFYTALIGATPAIASGIGMASGQSATTGLSMSLRGTAASLSIEIMSSVAMGSNIDLFDAFSGGAGILGYAFSPLIDLDSKNGLTTAFDKDFKDVYFEYASGGLINRFGKVSKGFKLKSSQEFAKSKEFDKIDYYGYHNNLSQDLAKEANNRGIIMNNLYEAAEVSKHTSSFVSKSIRKWKKE